MWELGIQSHFKFQSHYVSSRWMDESSSWKPVKESSAAGGRQVLLVWWSHSIGKMDGRRVGIFLVIGIWNWSLSRQIYLYGWKLKVEICQVIQSSWGRQVEMDGRRVCICLANGRWSCLPISTLKWQDGPDASILGQDQHWAYCRPVLSTWTQTGTRTNDLMGTNLPDGWKTWTNMPEPQYYKILKPLASQSGGWSLLHLNLIKSRNLSQS